MLICRIGLLVCFLGLAPGLFAGEARLLRYPDIHEDKVVFVYAGDIFLASSQGGVAVRLTTHKGQELFPKFSPDGKHIAFSAEYNGTRQIYTMPITGGAPRQLTWYNDVGPMPPRGGFDNRVLDWTPDGKNILFRGNRLPWGVRMGRFFTVPFEGGMEQALEIPEAGGGMYAPDGKKIVYTPIDREFRTWKRYRGGRAQDVWIYDLENHQSTRITDHPMTDNQPVWVGNALYFASDRNFTLNLFKYDLGSKQLEQVTNHQEFDVLWPSAGPESIVYENGGHLRVYTPGDGLDRALKIEINGDFPETLPRFENVKSYIQGSGLSPTGIRALFEARGDLFTVPAEKGQIRNLTQTQGIRERDPAWSPDGSKVAYYSDASGDYELYVRPADGSGEATKLTQDTKTWCFPPAWSPDSKKIAFANNSQQLQVVDVASGKITEVVRTTRNNPTNFSWAPDSNWLAYTQSGENTFSVIWAYNLATGKNSQLTEADTNNYSPVFSRDGKYLYFLSDRDYNITFSGFEFDYVYTRATRIYAATLNHDVANPFLPENEEEKVEAAANPEDKGTKKKSKKDSESSQKDGGEKQQDIRIDVEGFSDRVFVLPPGSDNYGGLSASAKGPVFVRFGNSGTELQLYDQKTEKTETIMENVGGYDLSANGEKLMYRMGQNFGVVDVAPKQKPDHLGLDTMTMRIEPKAEWRQIYNDAAQLVRDWFYDPNMHGFDWEALVARYRPLVDHVASRADLDYILGELGSELSSGHFYVNSGDQVTVARKDGGLLGAEMAADSSGRYRIAKIFKGENWHPNFRSPLGTVGIKAKVGDFILAVDGRDITTKENFYAALEGRGDQVVTLLVNDKPELQGAHEVRVKTITSERTLRYLDWVNSRKAYVEKASDGKIGYIHLPNTAFDGNRELFKGFYAQAYKQALILDDRYNGGGFIPGPMIHLLERPILSYWSQRGVEPFHTQAFAHDGPKVCLINGYSSSGGDAFPYFFRERNLGILIGTRTWGGLIGLQGNPGFADGGSLSIPMFRFFSTDGEWAVENAGVAPDIEVIDRPELIAAGKDPTLEAAVAHLLKKLEENPPKRPAVPTPPDESNNPPRKQ